MLAGLTTGMKGQKQADANSHSYVQIGRRPPRQSQGLPGVNWC